MFRHHGEEQFMTLFWVEFDTTSFVPWVLFALMTVVGSMVSRIFAKEVKLRHGVKQHL